MTIKEASIKFNLDEKEIRKRQQDGMIIGIRKDGRTVMIPENTEIIPSKMSIRSFLLQVLKQRNNNAIVVSRALCPDQETLKSLLKYLYNRGFIGNYNAAMSDELISKIQLTDEGISYVLGEKNYNSLISNESKSLKVNLNVINIESIL